MNKKDEHVNKGNGKKRVFFQYASISITTVTAFTVLSTWDMFVESEAEWVLFAQPAVWASCIVALLVFYYSKFSTLSAFVLLANAILLVAVHLGDIIRLGQ